jgi:hypothetical protein
MVSNIRTTVSGGAWGWMLWIWLNTNPPPGASSAIRVRTSFSTSSGVPKVGTRRVSQPPPQGDPDGDATCALEECPVRHSLALRLAKHGLFLIFL